MSENLSDGLKVTCNGEILEQLTKWGKPHARLMEVRGRPRYEKWLRAEKKRIKADEFPREVKIVKHPELMLVSLWVNERSDESVENSLEKIERSQWS